jgi:hypothetical protein
MRKITCITSPSAPGNSKTAANRRDVPYQSPIKVWLAEKMDAAGDR